ncbi:nucleoside triphosphate pyrophosphohydrolase [Aliiglaciecola sp. LCG003]|uniref:nucleoside triphosphate pyrophosphohydrolase n=1 Tax=Aliiglaciecola sp. LCG003 TaxID=3053655 RepID=UPI002572EA83|nr:nucleoside triphosphate pyrophosphohydrolase [Aliiglaciecola sp. LCG003]WJG08712.1 nucleoside triphosphate pyrophosphohydrolase [Aliiglaciecola sp. LCG003]
MQPNNNFIQTERLLWVMEQLRDPETGCPWDLQQTFSSIVPHTIEEAYEVADAIENGNMHEVKDELGDLLFQIVFYAQLGKEQQHFDFEAIAQTVADKLIRRHPHVFAQQSKVSVEQVAQNWDAIKQQERAAAGKKVDDSILANLTQGMAPLIKAQKLQKQCAKVGFDWPEISPVIDKIHEEIDEVMEEVNQHVHDPNRIEEEVGDLLFAVVNFARHAGVDAETALRKANVKFESRFRKIEQAFANSTITLNDASLEQMESEWQKLKNN